MSVGETEAGGCEFVDVRGGDLGGSVTTEIAVTDVVGVNEDDVRAVGGESEWCGEQRGDEERAEPIRGHVMRVGFHVGGDFRGVASSPVLRKRDFW